MSSRECEGVHVVDNSRHSLYILAVRQGQRTPVCLISSCRRVILNIMFDTVLLFTIVPSQTSPILLLWHGGKRGSGMRCSLLALAQYGMVSALVGVWIVLVPWVDSCMTPVLCSNICTQQHHISLSDALSSILASSMHMVPLNHRPPAAPAAVHNNPHNSTHQSTVTCSPGPAKLDAPWLAK